MRNYFRLVNSFMGDVYFEVSKHLGVSPYEVIKNKFRPDIKFLIIKYSQILRAKKKEYDKLEEQANQYK